MKRSISSIFATFFCAQVLATPVYHPPGPNLTYGSVSNSQTIMSEITNPAAGAAGLEKNGGGLRFGILSNIGIGYELGDVDDMYDRLDAVVDNFDANFNNVADLSDASLVDAQINEANTLLAEIDESGYAKAFVSAHVPIMPIVLSSNALGGSWVFDASFTGVAKVTAFGDPINFDLAGAEAFIASSTPGTPGSFDAGDIVVNYSGVAADFSYDIDDATGNDSSMVARLAGVIEAGIGYSTHITNFSGGKVFAGVRGKYYKVALLQAAEKFDDGNNNQNTEDFVDDLDADDGETSTGFGVDLGLLWVSDHLRFGAMITNLNEPEFEYNEFDTSGFNDPVILARMNEMSSGKYTMESQATVEAAIHSRNQRWVLSAALDLNDVEDPIGDKYQWATVSAAYASESWILPGARVGYRVNQAGSELSYLTGGVTLFKALNLDIAYSPDKVEDDSGSDVSRSIMFNLGLELTF